MKTKSIAALVICVCISGLPCTHAEESINPQTSKPDQVKNGEAPVSSQPAGSITIPEGTAFSVNLAHALDLSKVTGETNFMGELAHPIYQRERVLIPGGTKVQGRIALASQSALVPELTIIQMMIDGQQVPIKTVSVDATGTRHSQAQSGGKPRPVKWSLLQLPSGSMIEFRLSEPVTLK